MLLSLLLHGTYNHAGRQKFGTESFGKLDTLSVFAGHGETEEVDTAGAEPVFDVCNFIIHDPIIAYCKN